MATTFSRLASRSIFRSSFKSPFTTRQLSVAHIVRPNTRLFPRPFVFSVAAVGLGLFATAPRVKCDAPTVVPEANETRFACDSNLEDYPPPPVSSVSLYQLSFGTVTGICAGIFVKKGAKALAWFFGGVFVLLQYLSSASIVRVDWGRAATRFENAFHTKDANGISQPPSVVRIWRGLLDFLTADFQPRASFIAGFVLGLRIG